jgi:hypothetical protein
VTSRPSGLSLLLTGIVLFFLIRPIVDGIWFIGGLLGALSFGIGLLAMIGGGFLLLRRVQR